MGEEESRTVVEPYQLSYSDLLLLSSNPDPSLSSSAELKELESMRKCVLQALGPDGPGLLCITGVPNGSALRRRLLPFARKLALLDADDRKRILKDQCLGSDVPMKDPGRSVSSFAMQLTYAEGVENNVSKGIDTLTELLETGNLKMDKMMNIQDHEYNHLGITFKELGFLMMNLGICLARVCDSIIGGHELEQTLMESCSAKGRLIHYHSAAENLITKQGGKSTGPKKEIGSKKKGQQGEVKNGTVPLGIRKMDSTNNAPRSCDAGSSLWQQWHYDYGIFTVLTAPMFLEFAFPREPGADNQDLVSDVQEHPYPDGHIYLLILDPKKNEVFTVKTAPESFIIQVGESADILSKGKLRSTLHSVCRPRKHDNLSRETFVLFLQPAWSKTFSLSDYPMNQLVLGGDEYSKLPPREAHLAEPHNGKAMDILKVVPPLMSRLKDGMSFAEFSRETTKQYYGGSGLQSNR